MRALAVFVLSSAAVQAPTVKGMFYDPGDLGPSPMTDSVTGLRSIHYAQRFLHCGIHYWLETPDGTRLSVAKARTVRGPFTLHIRNNFGSGFLTVWDVSGEGRQLTPMDDRFSGGGRWSGYLMSDAVYRVPGNFEFSAPPAPHLVIVWARSQTEVSGSLRGAQERLKERPFASETDDSTPGEIGTYVMNPGTGFVVSHIDFAVR